MNDFISYREAPRHCQEAGCLALAQLFNTRCPVHMLTPSTYSESRIKPEMSIEDIIAEMSDGNPGAVNIMCNIYCAHGKAQAVMFLALLDRRGIYGSSIYLLMRDKCCMNAPALFSLLMTADPERLHALSKDQARQLPLTEEEERRIFGPHGKVNG